MRGDEVLRVGPLGNRISALTKETSRDPSPLCRVRTERERERDGRLWTRKRALARHRVCWRESLGPLASGTARNEHVGAF